MKKSVVMLTLASAGILPAMSYAESDGKISLYGIVDSYIGTTKTSGDMASVQKVGNGGLTSSFWGMSGVENLGGGLRAIFALESYFLVPTGQAGRTTTDAFFSHSAYVGLAGSYGTVTFGQHISPLYREQSRFSPFGASSTLNPVVLQSYKAAYGRTLAGDDLLSNAVVYSSPSRTGMSTTLAYSFGNAPGSVGTNNVLAIVDYTSKSFAATLGMQRLKIPTYPSTPAANLGAASSQTDFHAAASYDFSVAQIFAEYERANNGGVPRKDNIFALGATVRINSSNQILASWARNYMTFGQAPHQTRDTASLAYDYVLSKRTDTYVAYSYDKSSTQTTANTLIAGIRHRF
ncbi:UNVERIFIED_ORG: putative porin [Paraburkholderia sediminicola]|nr:putative porin [Paraburkholderia sediminicola]